MANPHKGEVPLEIGGTLYTLRLDFNALCSAEEFSSKRMPALIEDLQSGSFAAIRILLLAAISHQVPDMTLAKAGDLVQEAGPPKVMDALTKALRLTLPDADGAVAENPN